MACPAIPICAPPPELAALTHWCHPITRPTPPPHRGLYFFASERIHHFTSAQFYPVRSCPLPFSLTSRTGRHLLWPYQVGQDISDAFMRVWISLATIPCLGAILPSFPDKEPLVAFPMILPMGWVDSPNFLCAVTETIADLANTRFDSNSMTTTVHRLNNTQPDKEPRIATTFHGIPPPTTCSQGPLKPPLNFTDVYMDDFLAASQLSGADLDQACSTLFEAIDAVLHPLLPTDNPHRRDPTTPIAKTQFPSRNCSKGMRPGLLESVSWAGQSAPLPKL
jgi:hypothetical protein